MRRRREELDIGSKVVPTALAVFARPARLAGLNCDTVANPNARSALSQLDHLTAAVVAEDYRLLNDVPANSAFFVVMDIRSANTDRLHLDEGLARTGDRD